MSDSVIRTARRTWRGLGVPREAVEEMAAELAADLEEAQRDDIPPERYVGGDARAFAHRWAVERRVARPRFHVLGTALSAVLGALPGAGLGLFFAYGLSSDAMAEILGPAISGAPTFSPPGWLILATYCLAGLAAAGGALLAVSTFLRWRGDLALTSTTRLLALTVLPSLALGVATAMAYAWRLEYRTDARTVATEGALTVVVFAVGIALTRILAVLSTRRGWTWTIIAPPAEGPAAER